MLKINHLAVRLSRKSRRPETFDSPFALGLSKGERLAQDRLVEGEMAKYDTAHLGRKDVLSHPEQIYSSFDHSFPVCHNGHRTG